MIISPNEQGWAFDESTAWKLVYDGITIIFFDETEKAISTQSVLFVGTKDECDAEIARLGLPWASEVLVEPEYQLVYADTILYYSVRDATLQLEGTSFLGSKEACDAEIARLGLKWAAELSDDLPPVVEPTPDE